VSTHIRPNSLTLSYNIHYARIEYTPLTQSEKHFRIPELQEKQTERQFRTHKTQNDILEYFIDFLFDIDKNHTEEYEDHFQKLSQYYKNGDYEACYWKLGIFAERMCKNCIIYCTEKTPNPLQNIETCDL